MCKKCEEISINRILLIVSNISNRIAEIEKKNNVDNYDKKQIEEVIKNIMVYDGPDGHYDGWEIIVDFINELIKGNSKDWIDNYYKKNNIQP